MIDQLQYKDIDQGYTFTYIKGYSWDYIGNTLKLFDKHKNGRCRYLIVQENTSNLQNIISWDSQLSIIAESIYGSYSLLWRIIKGKDTKCEYIRNKIQERHNTIKYLIENSHLDTIESKTYSIFFEYLKT